MAVLTSPEEAPSPAALLDRLPLLRTWRVLREADTEYPRRSFIVEFAGMPKAGKSSAIESVRQFFSHGHATSRWKDAGEWINLRYQVHTPAEGVSLRTPAMLRDNSRDFNTWAGAYGLQELIRAGHDGYNDLVVLDRGPWDAGCWLKYWGGATATKREAESGEASEAATTEPEFTALIDAERRTNRDLDASITFFHDEQWMTRADLHVVLLVDPDEAAKREKKHRLIDVGGFSANPNKMRSLRWVYERAFDDLQSVKNRKCEGVADRSTLLIDTTAFTPTQAGAGIINSILEVLDSKVQDRAQSLQTTPTEIRNRLDNYWRRMKAEPRRRADQFLKDTYVRAINDLPPWKRLVILDRIKRLALPEAIAEARVPEDEVISTLREELEKVQRL